MSTYELLALLTALLAVVVSLVTLSRTHRLGKRQLELQAAQSDLARLQREMLEREKSEKMRAECRVRHVREGRGGDYFVFENFGPAGARDVNLDLDLPAPRETEEVVDPRIDSEVAAILPIQKLRAGESVRMMVAVYLSMIPPFVGRLSWTDGAGAHTEDCRIHFNDEP